MRDSRALDELISLLLGLLVPMLVSWYKGNTWSDRRRMLASLVICTIVGALSALTTHTLVFHETMTLNDWLTNATAVFTSATAFYKLHFQNTRTNEKLEQRGPFSEPGNNTP
jgi:hypothetical protein